MSIKVLAYSKGCAKISKIIGSDHWEYSNRRVLFMGHIRRVRARMLSVIIIAVIKHEAVHKKSPSVD